MSDVIKHLDIETVFREDSRELLRLAYPDPVPGTETADLEVIQKTQKDVEKYLSDERPSMHALLALIDEENFNKGRKGVLEVLNKALNEYMEDPIPNKTKMIPECCEIIAIGYGTAEEARDGNAITMDASEGGMLDEFWHKLDKDMTSGVQGPFGWRLATFDIPVMVAASARHGVKVPSYVQAGTKYGTTGFIDMANRRGWSGKLRDICLATGFAEDRFDPLGTGAGVHGAWVDGNWTAIGEHCKIDLLRCQHMFELYKGILW